MQRAPCFGFSNARESRAFCQWVSEHVPEIKERAESTTRSGKLTRIERYTVSRMVYLRFDYTTGDAAGQNMVGKATSVACDWIRGQYPGIQHFQLSGNFDTDKKASQVNMMHTRGKRVVAEVTIPKQLLRDVMHVDSQQMFRARLTSNTGAFLAGSNNNGQHAANAIAAIFIATGQDAANVAESSAAITHSELLPNGDYYYSITLPSLIVATYGGGTALPSQRECLEMLGCYGAGKVYKFAEIVAATVLCGELSLGSAVVAEEWVKSHDQYGRNRK
jgi:hydroxymethylglutaryl-CoA reductase (NADPH)